MVDPTFGFTISAPGLYYLCETIIYNGPNSAITITGALAQDVTLDLGGYTIIATSGTGIEVSSLPNSASNIVIKNGTISTTLFEAIAILSSGGVYISDIIAFCSRYSFFDY